MTVKEVIKSSAELLGIELTDENIEYWLNAYNNVENELAMDYFHLRSADKVLIKENKIKYSDLGKNAWRIMGVYDCNNHDLMYKLCPTYIGFAKKENEKYCFVCYCYVPQEKDIDDISDFDVGMFKDILKYGVCSEYCLVQGKFEEAKIWDSKYKNLIEIAYITKGRKNEYI